jgi:hypothetical protein
LEYWGFDSSPEFVVSLPDLDLVGLAKSVKNIADFEMHDELFLPV